MAEAPEAEPVPTTSESLRGPEPAEGCAPEASAAAAAADDDEPIAKRPKLGEGLSDRLEFRLGGILCCAVCLDLPPAAVYQCCNGHLMCAPCFTHLLADARLRDETHATCPNCRVEISKTTASRNLAVEKTVSELPLECKYCLQVFPRHSLLHHEENTCEERLMGCRYAVIGCPWRGPAHEACGHEQACLHPCKSAADVVAALQDREKAAAESAALYTQMLDLLSYEKITFNDLQLKPYRTEEFMTKLYYESSRFSAFGQQWVVKAFVNKNQRDPTQCPQREITYQLILKSKPLGPVAVQWVVVRGPHGEARLHPAPRAYVYREEAAAAPPLPLPLADPADANRLLANKAIHFRLIMFQACK